jgi:hypothetical protein
MIVATVKAVTSGDTVVLKSTKSGAEKVLSLAFISAPRLRREGDEVCGFLEVIDEVVSGCLPSWWGWLSLVLDSLP